MMSKLTVIAVMILSCSYAEAGSSAIGTASARGDLRIDGSSVKGNATLFDGTVVETGQATAALRLSKGVEITLATESRSTLFHDRVVLQQGTSEFAPSGPFLLEANGLEVTSSEPNSRAVVSMSGSNTVEVAALAGGFQVTNGRGLLLARVNPGRAMSFAIQTPSEQTGTLTITGQVLKGGHHFYLRESTTNTLYELTGRNFNSYVGREVQITATLKPGAPTSGDAKSVVSVSSLTTIAVSGVSAGIGTGTSILILGSIAVAVAGIGYGVSQTSGPSTPASQ